MSYKYYEELAKSKGKKLLIESFSVSSIKPEQVEILKEKRLVECSSGNSVGVVGIIRDILISRYTENLNKRVYNRKLWERIHKLGLAENTYMLCGHPKDGDDDLPEKVMGLWKNFRITEEGPICDLYLLEGGHDYGKLLMSSIVNGGPGGVSTVGFGEMLYDNVTVDPDSFDLERCGDWVLKPSQSTYISYENIKESTNNDKIISSTNTNKSGIKFQENTHNMSVEALNKLTEANLRSQVKAVIKEAKSSIKTRDISKIRELQKEIKEMCDIIPMEDEKAKLMGMHGEMESAMEDEVAQREKSLGEMGEQYTSLKTKYDSMSETFSALKDKYNRAIKVIEKLGGNETDPAKLKIIEDMEDDIKKFSEDRIAMEEEIKVLMAEREDMLDDIRIFTEERNLMNTEIEMFKEDISERDADIKLFVKDRVTMSEDIERLKSDRKNLKEDLDILAEGVEIKAVKPKTIDMEPEEGYRGKPQGKKVAIKAVKPGTKEMKPKNSKGSAPMPDMKMDTKPAPKPKMEAKSIFDEDFETPYGDLDSPKANFPWATQDGMESIRLDPALSRRASHEPTGKLSDSVKRTEKKPAMVESVSPIAKELKLYYAEKVEDAPSLAKVKSKILNAKSFAEASRIVEAWTKDEDKMIRMTESTSVRETATPSWLEGFN